MAPLIATGLGLTETAGFCTYTPMTSSIDEITAGLGFDMPLYAMTIRATAATNYTKKHEFVGFCVAPSTHDSLNIKLV